MKLLRLNQLPSVEGTWNPKLPIKASSKVRRCSQLCVSGQGGTSESRMLLAGGSEPGNLHVQGPSPPPPQRLERCGDRG